jgi:hypothetical protein
MGTNYRTFPRFLLGRFICLVQNRGTVHSLTVRSPLISVENRGDVAVTEQAIIVAPIVGEIADGRFSCTVNHCNYNTLTSNVFTFS